ncbi:MFS transporter [Sulfobacillus harzensis]|nr:MFS transporter [Sulfobacillus harzensis]
MAATNGILPLSAEERPTFWATFFGWGLDGFDYMMYALVLTAILGAFHLNDAEGGLLGTTTLILSALGGILAGTMADRMGRARTLALAVFIYSLFTALSGLATSYPEMLVFRGLEGLGFGGEWAVGAVLIAETVRGDVRGRVLGLVQGAWAFGWALAVIASLIILPNAGAIGWRVMFWIGLLPALLCIYVMRRVPEPPIWAKEKTRVERAASVSFFHIFSRKLLKRTVFAALLAVGAQSGYYAIFTWLPTYLKTDRHLSVVGSGGYLFVVIVGSFVGYVLSGMINDWIGRKLTFVFYAVFSGLIILVYTHFAISNGVMLVLSFPLGFFASGIFSGFGPFLAELYPTKARGAGQGFTYNFGRGVAGFAPALVGVLAVHYGLAGGISVFGPAAYVLCLIALIFLPETRGMALEQAA